MVVARGEVSKRAKIAVPDDFSGGEKEKLDAAMDYPKSAVVFAENLEKIKEKMIETMKYRTMLMRNQKMDIKESFPFLFASIDLVLLCDY